MVSNVIKWNSLPAIEQETLNFPNTEWVRASDHERIVAELRETIVQMARTQRESAKAITKQKRVIEKLSEQKKSSFFTKEQSEKWAEESLDDATENDY